MTGHRAGFVSLIGRPNAGKSTLLNRLVREKLAIVSPRPQTTRNRITGILNVKPGTAAFPSSGSSPSAQIVFVDTPGLHAGGGKLGEFMLKTAEKAIEDVDVLCLVVDASEGNADVPVGNADVPEGNAAVPVRNAAVPARSGPDALVLGALRSYGGPVFCVLNKVDRVRPKSRMLPLIERWRNAYPFREILPISAATGTNCDRLLELIVRMMPEHPSYFPDDVTTDQPETFYVAEVVREKVFQFTHQDVPYAVAIQVQELIERPGERGRSRDPECLYIRARVFVEQPSQRGILIGKHGGMLKRIGTAARKELEAFFGIKVFLDLTVEVRRNWRRDDRALREFGLLLTS